MGARADGFVNGRANACPSRYEYMSQVAAARVSFQVWLSKTFMLSLMPTAPHWLTRASATLWVSFWSCDAPSWMTMGCPASGPLANVRTPSLPFFSPIWSKRALAEAGSYGRYTTEALLESGAPG